MSRKRGLDVNEICIILVLAGPLIIFGAFRLRNVFSDVERLADAWASGFPAFLLAAAGLMCTVAFGVAMVMLCLVLICDSCGARQFREWLARRSARRRAAKAERNDARTHGAALPKVIVIRRR